MSYILDALNKSERERARRRAPDLHALGDQSGPNAFGPKQFGILACLIVVINVAALWYFFGDRSKTDPVTDKQLTNETNVNTVVPQTAARTKSSEPATGVASEGVAPDGVPPNVNVTAHIFAEDRDLRMVKIDGISRKEGEMIQEGLRLIEITESGVILEYDNQAYVLNIVEDWQLY